MYVGLEKVALGIKGRFLRETRKGDGGGAGWD